MRHVVSPEQRDFYHRHGYVCLRQVLPDAVIELGKSIAGQWAEKTIGGWLREGLITDGRRDLDLSHRLATVWEAAGRPQYLRSPRRDLVGPTMYRFLTHPTLLDIAEDLLDTPEIASFAIFAARPKLPDQLWTDTPWHQDAQYYRDAEHVHVVSMWAPLVSVDEQNSCLQVAPDMHRGKLYEEETDETGFRGIPKAERAALKGISIPMQAGDLLCFNQKTPHRALPNRTDTVRWSLDVRYGAAPTRVARDSELSFIARSAANPAGVETSEQWIAKWADRPEGTF